MLGKGAPEEVMDLGLYYNRLVPGSEGIRWMEASHRPFFPQQLGLHESHSFQNGNGVISFGNH